MKAILLLFGLLAINQATYSQHSTDTLTQTSTKLRWNAGVKGGFNLASAYGISSKDFDATPKIGFAGGLFFNVPIVASFSVHPEILIAQRGVKATDATGATPYTLDRTTTYLDFPVFITYQPTRFFSLLLGPQFSRLLNQRDTFSEGTSTQIKETFQQAAVRDNSVSILLGADFYTSRLVIGTRLGWDTRSNSSHNTTSMPPLKYVWYQITLGYSLFSK